MPISIEQRILNCNGNFTIFDQITCVFSHPNAHIGSRKRTLRRFLNW